METKLLRRLYPANSSWLSDTRKRQVMTYLTSCAPSSAKSDVRKAQKDQLKKSVSNRLNLLLPHIYKLIQLLFSSSISCRRKWVGRATPRRRSGRRRGERQAEGRLRRRGPAASPWLASRDHRRPRNRSRGRNCETSEVRGKTEFSHLIRARGHLAIHYVIRSRLGFWYIHKRSIKSQ